MSMSNISAVVREQARELVAGWPAPTDEQCDRLVQLLGTYPADSAEGSDAA